MDKNMIGIVAIVLVFVFLIGVTLYVVNKKKNNATNNASTDFESSASQFDPSIMSYTTSNTNTQNTPVPAPAKTSKKTPVYSQLQPPSNNINISTKPIITSTDKYLRAVYPLWNGRQPTEQNLINSLQFFYIEPRNSIFGYLPANIATNINTALTETRFVARGRTKAALIKKSSVRRKVDNETNKVYAQLPAVGQAYIMVWQPPGTEAINVYNKSKWWEGKVYITPFVEVMHTPDDNQDYYKVHGTWFYVTKGSGIFLDTAFMLTAKNKIDALIKLGMTYDDLAQQFPHVEYMIETEIPSQRIIDLVTGKVTNYVSYPEHMSLEQKLSSMFHDIHQTILGNNNLILKNKSVMSKYHLDRVNNTADFDLLLTSLAKGHGYQCVSLSHEANGCGGWGHELVWVDQPLDLLHDVERMHYLIPQMYIADPANPFMHEICQFVNDDKYNCLACQQQGIYRMCNMPLKPQDLSPTTYA